VWQILANLVPNPNLEVYFYMVIFLAIWSKKKQTQNKINQKKTYQSVTSRDKLDGVEDVLQQIKIVLNTALQVDVPGFC
jgi:hypothetical protein